MQKLNKILIFLFVGLSCSFSSGTSLKSNKWYFKTYYEASKDSKAKFSEKRSVIQFKNSLGKEVTYRPQKEPFGLAKQQLIAINNKSFFITLWPDGPEVMLLRVFDPANSSEPLCEVYTYSNQMALQFSDKVLSVKKYSEETSKKKSKETWELCYTYK